MKFPSALIPSRVTILGYGSLLSESSSRVTFPHLTNFRHVRVFGLRRVFAHPHLFLIGEEEEEEEAAKPKHKRYEHNLEMAALSVEPTAENENVSFVAAAFDVELDDAQREAFVRREQTYRISTTNFVSISGEEDAMGEEEGEGVICLASRDADLDPHFMEGLPSDIGTVWHWPHDSGILPHRYYLRHCLLAVSSSLSSSQTTTTTTSTGDSSNRSSGARVAYESFLNDTYLADRKTSLKEYLQVMEEDVMASRPPEHLKERYGG